VCEHNSAKRFYSYCRGAAGVQFFAKTTTLGGRKLRKREMDGSAASKPYHFLHKPQKRFGTPREFQSCMGSLRCRADGWPSAVMRRGARRTTRFKARACAGEAAQAV
jgi:hypothetical protein